MPALNLKRKREEEDAGEKLRKASKAAGDMFRAAGEEVLMEGTEDACHFITDRFVRCSWPGIRLVLGVRDPEEPDYDFVYCAKHARMLQNPTTLAVQQERVERCLAAARAAREPVVPFNPFVGVGAAAALTGAAAEGAGARVVASNNPFLAAAQVPVSNAMVPVDNVVSGFARMALAE